LVIGAGWDEALRLAGAVAEASAWRQQLADAMRAASSVALATVWTCPPAQPMEARGATSPEHMHASIDMVRSHVIPLVERTAEGVSMQRGSLSTRPYLPFEATRQTDLARKALAGYAPAGVEALVVCWLLDPEGLPLGYIAVGDGGSGEALLERVGEPLQLLAERAGQTLHGTLSLAKGLGALPPPPPAPGVAAALLTVRERQVARLVAEGCSDAVVSHRLGMSENTVGVHLRRIFSKLGVHSRAELLSRGVIALPEEAPSPIRRGRR